MKSITKLLILAFVFSLFATACGGAEPEVFDLDLKGDTQKTDLGGVSISYVVGLANEALAVPTCLGYELDTLFGDLAMKRVKDVQNDLNCVFNIRYDQAGVSNTAFLMTSMSGIYMCDVIMGTSDIWADVAKVGMVIGMTELEDYIDFRNEEKWGYRNMLEVVYYEDDLYGIVPLLWPEISVSYSAPLVINENLITELNLDDPRDLYENGKWVWDTFEDFLMNSFVKEGSDVKYYSLTCSPSVFGYMFLLSNGPRYVEKDPSGKYVCGFYSEPARRAMRRGIDMYYGPCNETIHTSGDALQDLIGVKTVMAPLDTDNIIGIRGRIAKEMDNFGFLCWPSGPDVDPGYVVGQFGNIERCIAFSRLSQYPEASAMAINALYEPFEEYPTLDSLIDLMAKNYFFDRRDAEMYYKMCFNSVYNYFHYSGMFDFMHNWLSPTKSPSEYLESNENMMNKRMEENVLPRMRGLIAVWGEQ